MIDWKIESQYWHTRAQEVRRELSDYNTNKKLDGRLPRCVDCQNNPREITGYLIGVTPTIFA